MRFLLICYVFKLLVTKLFKFVIRYNIIMFFIYKGVMSYLLSLLNAITNNRIKES